MSVIIEKYSAKLENLASVRDSSVEPIDSNMVALSCDHNCNNLIKVPKCFRFQHCRCVDPIVTNKNLHLLREFNDHHHRQVNTIFKSNFRKFNPKKVVYREYENFNGEHFLTDLNVNLTLCHPTEYQAICAKEAKDLQGQQ